MDGTSLALLKTNTTQQQISQYLSTIRKAINKDFVEFFLGANKEREFYIKHNNICTIELHQLQPDELAIFADATYCRIEKSADNQFQYSTWSQQKLDLLIKPFVVCCSDGYIIDIYGPYKANNNDAVIFDHILETDKNLKNILQSKKTVCFLDRGLLRLFIQLTESELHVKSRKLREFSVKARFFIYISIYILKGFRDIHTKLVEEYGYRVEIPHCQQLIKGSENSDDENNEEKNEKKTKQLSTSDANRTRNVTKVS